MDRMDLGERTDLGAVRAVIDVPGLKLIDVGCGPAMVSRELAALGATVLGVEPDPSQAAKNRAAEPVQGLTLVEGRAERLPAESGSVDGVFFFRSLHHVPVEQMENALAEAARVLKPQTGFLCIFEPGMSGTHFQVMKPFHDETRVRTAAQAALGRIFGTRFAKRTLYRYDMFPRYQSFEAMVARVTGQTFNNITRDRVETEEVRTLFESARSEKGDYVFTQPMLFDVYREPQAA